MTDKPITVSDREKLRLTLKDMDVIKRVFLVPNYDDQLSGWIVQDHLESIEELIKEVLGEET